MLQAPLVQVQRLLGRTQLSGIQRLAFLLWAARWTLTAVLQWRMKSAECLTRMVGRQRCQRRCRGEGYRR